jgi:nucleoside-diphosphate-sugar epimerase
LVHPGHIVGTGWVPLNPAGNFNPSVYATLARGEELSLPNFGLETVHHVHADDVAGVIMSALARPSASVGEAFHAVSDAAITLRGFAEEMFRWHGREPRLRFAPYEQWASEQSSEDASATWEHIARSPNCSMTKARELLGFVPRYTSLQAVQESVTWLVDQGRLDLT